MYSHSHLAFKEFTLKLGGSMHGLVERGLTMLQYQFNFVLLQFSRIHRDTEDSLITQLRKGSAETLGKCTSLGDSPTQTSER